MKKKEVKKLTKTEIHKNIEKLKKDLFNFRFQKVNSQITNPAKINETKKEIDTKVIEITPTENTIEKVITPEIKNEEEVVITKKSYFIIAGAFSKEKNANKFVKQLQEENYNSSIIGKTKGGLIRVCFDSFETKEEALISLKNLKSENKSAWLLSL